VFYKAAVSASTRLPSDRFSLFSEARERMGKLMAQATAKLVPALSQVLSRQAERAIDLKARVELQESLHELNKQRDALPNLVMQRFNELAFKRLDIESRDSGNEVMAGLLALLPDAELEEQVYSNELAQRIRTAGGQEYAALVTRIHALTQFSANEDQSPFSASVIAASFVMSLRVITHDRIAWATIRPELSEDLPQDMAEAMADVNDFLRAANIVPEIPRFVAKIEMPVAPLPAAHTPVMPEALSQNATAARPLSANPSPERQLNAMTRPGLIARAVAAVDQAGSSGLKTGRSFMQSGAAMHQRALDTQRMLSVEHLEREGTSFASGVGVAAYSAAAREKFFTLLRDGLRDQQSNLNRDAQLAIVDVVHSLFDYALDEHRVPDAARPLLWRLQLPTVILALLDPRYLGDQASSIRRLVENLSAIISAFPDDVFKGSELYTRLESAVRAVEVVAHTLQTRTSVMAGLIEKQFSESSTGVAMIAQRVKAQRTSLESMPGRRNRRDYRARPSRETEIAITEKLNQAIDSRLSGRVVPDAVRQFLKEVWIRRLRSAALRDGEESKDFQIAMQIVDDLLWSLEDKDKRLERRELAVQIPPLIQQLTSGVKAVGVDEKELASFFDELFLVHLRRMQRQEQLAQVLTPGATVSAVGAVQAAEKSKPEMSIVQAMARPVTAPAVSEPLPADLPVIPELPEADLNDAVDWPVLTDDLRLEEGAQKRVSSNFTLPSISNVPSIPSLDNLVPSKAPTAAKASNSLGTRAQRVKPNPDLKPFRIQGMDQLASAASINLNTLPLVKPQQELASNAPMLPAAAQGGSVLSQRVTDLPSDLSLGGSKKSVPSPTRSDAAVDSASAEANLLGLLSAVSVEEGHAGFLRSELSPSEAVDRLAQDVWIELVSSSQGARFAKVAWLNPQRSLVLLVREHDRKALSLRVSDMLTRFAQRRAFVLRPPEQTRLRDLR
jgi:hypothetical protein